MCECVQMFYAPIFGTFCFLVLILNESFILFLLQVEAELVYAAELRDLNARVNTQENVVGWWATGSEVTRHSSLIHDYYTIECPNAIHLTLDTTLQGGNMGIKAYVR